MRAFFGNTGVLVRAYCYIRTHGPDGLRRVSENAVLNANYLLSRVKHFLPVPQGDRCMHEFVASAAKLKAEKGISAMDLAKRLLDYGFHAPTVYFPLTVKESIMVEPTETESKETLDAFAETLFRIIEEDPDLLHDAPHTTPISRPDEVQAARQPVLVWPRGDARGRCCGDMARQSWPANRAERPRGPTKRPLAGRGLGRTRGQVAHVGATRRSFLGRGPFPLAAAKMSLPRLPNRAESTIRWLHWNLFGRSHVKANACGQCPHPHALFDLLRTNEICLPPACEL